MDLTYKTERLSALNPKHIARAAQLLRAGETVAFPTETVYGLGANALSPRAVAKIFLAKQRPPWDPLIVHIADRAMLPSIASMPPGCALEDGSPLARLMARFWPGPLTLLLPRTPDLPDPVTAGRPLVGVRMPAHPIALELLRQAGIPVAAPSANQFGHTSPTTAAHVLSDLDGRIAAVLDGGPTTIGVESTVVDVSFEATRPLLRIYRPGAIDQAMLDELGIGRVELFTPHSELDSSPESLPSPGVGIRHYAPNARLQLVELSANPSQPQQLALVSAIDAASPVANKVGVLLPEHWPSPSSALVYPWGPWDDPDTLARNLFAGLRALDDRGASTIVCPLPEPGGLRDAIRDRLQKAARPIPLALNDRST